MKSEHYSIPEATGVEVLRFLMDEHGLTESSAWKFLCDNADSSNKQITEVSSDVVEGTIAPQEA